MSASELVLHFGRPSVHLEGRDSEDVVALAYHLHTTLKSKFYNVLLSDPAQACLIVDSCDGTPLITRKRLRCKTDALGVIRSQRSTGEWLIQRQLCLTESGGRAVLFSHPRQMKTKTSWAHFQATRELSKTGREFGLTGLVIQHTVLDRAIQGSLHRHMKELHNLVHAHMTRNMSEGRAWLLTLLTWPTSAGCSMHDFHTGFKRGMAAYINEKQFTSGLYGAVEALRDSFSSIVQGLGEWLPSVVRFVDWDIAEQEVYAFYCMFALPPPLVEALMTLQLRFDGTHLCIAKKMEESPTSAQLVTTELLSLWRFSEWSDSRWGGMGKTSKAMVGAFATGLCSCVEFLRYRKAISEYYIKACTNMTDRHRRAFVVGAMSSHLSDAVLYELLDDNRVPLLLPTIDNEIRMETEWLLTIPDSHWGLLANLCGASVVSLKSECIDATLTSAC